MTFQFGLSNQIVIFFNGNGIPKQRILDTSEREKNLLDV